MVFITCHSVSPMRNLNDSQSLSDLDSDDMEMDMDIEEAQP